ncbi:gephyrin-like molybdotransferase Glp [Angustibacter sp. McL0619]|uniref:molybdotransferase-like divisome protein Glp n=1 Tax=Angustibacter sp. McL0619 TaxID=3415676 RepID=UPI003CEF4C19
MIGVEDHLARCLDGVQALDPIDLALLEAQDCVLTEDVVSPLDLPGFDNSAMDGYAVTVADVSGASATTPVELPVVGDIAAGSTRLQQLPSGQTMRIMTGAPVPAGAQAVVPVEDSDGGVHTVRLTAAAENGQHVRVAGSDVRCGDVVLTAGTLLGPAQLALLAAVGRARVRVHAQPRVVVLSTGSELVDPGVAPAFGQVVDSNGVMLTAAAIDAGARPYRVGVVRDEAGAFLQTLTDQLVRADLVVTTGGVSAGAYDTVKEVLRGLGTVWFGKVAMQPGMPQGFGTVGPDGTPIFTLPGNPASAYVSFEMFVRPAIRKMAGHRGLFRRSETATALESWSSPAGKLQLARAELGTTDDGERVVRLAGAQGSYVLGGLARASALVVVPEAVTRVAEGDQVRCLVLDRRSR